MSRVDDVEESDSISSEFLNGQKLWLELEDASSSDPDYKDKVKRTKAHLNNAAILVNRLNLFAPNETARDFHSTQLRYALIPYYLGLVEQLVGEPNERRVRVDIAKRCFENFYGLCERLGLISAQEKDEIELLEEKEESLAPQQRRDILVSQARRNREHSEKIHELTRRKLAVLNRQGEGAEESDADLNDTEEEIVHSQIKIAVARSYREIRTIEREIPLIERMMELEKDPKKALADREAHARLVATSKTDSRFCPYTIIKDGRGGLRKKVFCAHWIQPTVTIEEAGEIDYRIAMQEQAARDRAQAEGRRAKARNSDEEFDPAFDSDPDDDAKVRKARDWDEYKDDHPSGSGNTMANVG